ncbi:MAG TPA: sigma-70 family RNA polymerase sigma factor [Baekduia sp.]|jgi:RNA polymerase sigma-70 factor (ECF subfamily)
MSMNGIKARADQLGTQRPAGAFRAKASLDESPASAPLVARAVARAKEGDREAVRFLYLRYADNVYGYVRSIVRDEYEAEDVTQQVFAKLMVVIGKYEQRAVPFSAWILRLAHNAAIDHMRKRRAIPAAEVYGADERVPEGNEDRSRELRLALADLPEEQRDVLVLRHVVGLSPTEIAGHMGKTEPSIHGLHHRGRAALRTALVERGCAPTVAVKVAA